MVKRRKSGGEREEEQREQKKAKEKKQGREGGAWKGKVEETEQSMEKERKINQGEGGEGGARVFPPQAGGTIQKTSQQLAELRVLDGIIISIIRPNRRIWKCYIPRCLIIICPLALSCVS